MRARLNVLAIAIVTALTVGVTSACSATSLPEVRPADLHVTYTISGGMVPEGSQASITAGGGAVITYNNGTRDLVTFPVTSAELDTLYAALRAAQFDLIETEPSNMHDAPSAGVQVGYGDVWISVIEGPDHVLPEWEPQFRAAWDAVQSVVAEHFTDPSGTVTVVYDASLRDAEVMLTVGGASGFSRNDTSLNPNSWRSVSGTITVNVMAWLDNQVLTLEAPVQFTVGTLLAVSLSGNTLSVTTTPVVPSPELTP